MVARLSMWNASLGDPSKGRGADLTTRVQFYAEAQRAMYPGISHVNIVDISHTTPGRKVNRLLVKYSNGMFVLDSGNRDDGEIVEDFLTLDVADLPEAQRLAQRHLDELAAGELAITVTLQPVGLIEGGKGDVPYVHFSVGDWVMAPAEDLTSTRYRVMAITINGDDDGGSTAIIELNRRVFSAEQQRISLLKTLGSGEVGKVSTSEQVTGYIGSGD